VQAVILSTRNINLPDPGNNVETTVIDDSSA
jgi:hypothetical protein